MKYWILRGSERSGPHTAEDLVWNLKGDLDALIYRGGDPTRDRRGWKLGRFFPELVALSEFLPETG